MKPDFDPYDLTPRVAQNQEPSSPPQPKPTIRRVSMGPIFHSRISKSLALILGIILAALIGYITVDYYYAKKNSAAITTVTSQPSSISKDSVPDTKLSSNTVSETTPVASSQPTTAPATTTKPAPTYCGVSGMPEGVCTMITSIRNDGLANNKYVSADTSKVPDGTKTEIDEKSWTQPAPELGNFKFTVSQAGQKKSGVAYTQLSGGVWKVISYTLNQ